MQEQEQKKKSTKKRKDRKPRVLLDVSSFPHDEKGNAIVPDDFLDANYKNLPDGTKNESGSYRVLNSGKLIILGGDPERDAEIHKAGGEAMQATLQQRKSLGESIDDLLRRKACREDLEKYGLPEGCTNQEVITAALFAQAAIGNMKAYTALRDTVGEMPVTRQKIEADVTTDADRLLMEKLEKRLNTSE